MALDIGWKQYSHKGIITALNIIKTHNFVNIIKYYNKFHIIYNIKQKCKKSTVEPH